MVPSPHMSKRHNCIVWTRAGLMGEVLGLGSEVWFALLAFGGDIEARFGTVQSVQGAFHIDRRIAARQPLFGALFGFARAFHVNIRRTFRCLRQNCYLVRQDLGESPSYSQT